MSTSNSDDALISQIEKLITEAMDNSVAIKGISIGTNLATNIYTKLKQEPNLKIFSESELIASATSFQYIAKNLFEYINQSELASTYVTVENFILMVLIVKQVSAAVILDKNLAELEGLPRYQKSLRELVLQIAAFVETSELMKEDPFVQVKRAIPTAEMVAFISNEGMPLKVEGGTPQLQEAMLGSMVAAISNLTQVIMKKPMDYTVLQGIGGEGRIVFVIRFDDDKILAVSFPARENENIGKNLAKIKEIIQGNKTK